MRKQVLPCTALPAGVASLSGCVGLQAKILVFLTTGKQVKFALEAFRRLRPGVVLRALHGKMKQMKRMAVFYDFSEVCRRPSPRVASTAMFRTSLAAWCWLKCSVDLAALHASSQGSCVNSEQGPPNVQSLSCAAVPLSP